MRTCARSFTRAFAGPTQVGTRGERGLGTICPGGHRTLPTHATAVRLDWSNRWLLTKALGGRLCGPQHPQPSEGILHKPISCHVLRQGAGPWAMALPNAHSAALHAEIRGVFGGADQYI